MLATPDALPRAIAATWPSQKCLDVRRQRGARCGGPGRGPPWLRAKSCEQCLSWCVLNKFGFPCVAAVYDRTTRGCELFEKACDLVPAKDHATFSLPPPEPTTKEPAKEAAVDVAKPVPAPQEAAPLKVDVLDTTKPSPKFVDPAVPAVNASANATSNSTEKEDSYESYSYGWWPPEASPSPDPDPESSNATDPELLGVVTDEEVDPTLENDENGTPITHTMSGLTGAGVGDDHLRRVLGQTGDRPVADDRHRAGRDRVQGVLVPVRLRAAAAHEDVPAEHRPRVVGDAAHLDVLVLAEVAPLLDVDAAVLEELAEQRDALLLLILLFLEVLELVQRAVVVQVAAHRARGDGGGNRHGLIVILVAPPVHLIQRLERGELDVVDVLVFILAAGRGRGSRDDEVPAASASPSSSSILRSWG